MRVLSIISEFKTKENLSSFISSGYRAAKAGGKGYFTRKDSFSICGQESTADSGGKAVFFLIVLDASPAAAHIHTSDRSPSMSPSKSRLCARSSLSASSKRCWARARRARTAASAQLHARPDGHLGLQSKVSEQRRPPRRNPSTPFMTRLAATSPPGPSERHGRRCTPRSPAHAERCKGW